MAYEKIIFKIIKGGNYMQVETITNQILYVPFGEDYAVDSSIKTRLTEKEFFDNCYYMPDFDKEIQEILDMPPAEITAFDVDLTKDEIIQKYRRSKREMGALYNWINSNQNDIFCIKGDAGTGKTTFLHYLKYTQKDVSFDIIDIQKTRDGIKILDNYFTIEKNDNNIHYKLFSGILKNIVNELFVTFDDGELLVDESIKTFYHVVESFNRIYKKFYPRKDIKDFFYYISEILGNNLDKEIILEECADYIFSYFRKLFENKKSMRKSLVADILELYIFILCSKRENIRHILAIDNLERFIRTDEIYNKQLTELVDDIRSIQKTISDNNIKLSGNYQIIVFMRNTSSRMMINQQAAELFPHVVDLSEWFQSSKIIEKKVGWYNDNNIYIESSELLLDIMNDIGYCDGNITGMRSKLNMLFNNNKRVVVNILTNVLENPANSSYLRVYDYFRKNEGNINLSYAQFAKRIIIFRLVLNELREEHFFKNIIAQREENEPTSLGYARKILSILYEYKLQNETGYMPFSNIIMELDSNSNNAIERYFIPYDQKKRMKIAKVLYYMNYYDGRTDNWLQFIDIQYNISQKNVRIEGYSQLEKLIDESYQNIGIKITNAGIAYLYFVICSFEFFSCKSYSVAQNKREFKDGNLPPLLCVIPSVSDIKNKKCEELECIKIIDFVSSETIRCIYAMKTDHKNIPFRKNLDDKFISHTNRIVYSHIGFINNYIQCMRELYKDEMRNDTLFVEKFERIELKLEKIREVYKKCLQ